MVLNELQAHPADGISTRLAEHLTSIDLSELPEGTSERARLVLLDTAGAMLAGAAHSSSTAAVRQTVLAFGDQGKSTIIGEGVHTSAPWAAMCNGVAAHAFEMDDAHRHATGYHPGATVIPAVLAVAEQMEATVPEVLEAIVTGYEAGGLIGRAVNPSHRYRGFHSTGTVGVFGAAAGVGKLLSFDAREMLMVLGVAGSMAAGVFAFLDGAHPTKHLHAGHAAHVGVLSALLVRSGITGPSRILEGPDGFFAAYADEVHAERMKDRLGTFLEIHSTYFKPFAACGHSFSAVEAAQELANDGVRAEDVLQLTVESYRAAAVLANRTPTTLQQGQFSLPYLVAAALSYGQLDVARLAAGLHDPALMDLTSRCEVREDVEMTEAFPRLRQARVTTQLRDGTSRSALIDIPVGMPERPLSRAQILAKFDGVANRLLGADSATRLKNAVLSGEGSLADLVSIRIRSHEPLT